MSKKILVNVHKIPKNYAVKSRRVGKCRVGNPYLPDSLEFGKSPDILFER